MGGMIYGLLLGLGSLSYLSRKFFGIRTSVWVKMRTKIVGYLAMIISVLGILISFAVVVSFGENVHCSRCRYISCVAFPFWTAKDNKWWYCDDCDMIKAYSFDFDTDTLVTMTCPNSNATTSFYLGYRETDDKKISKSIVPKECRARCDETYFNYLSEERYLEDLYQSFSKTCRV
jgi:hypothetical protein